MDKHTKELIITLEHEYEMNCKYAREAKYNDIHLYCVHESQIIRNRISRLKNLNKKGGKI